MIPLSLLAANKILGLLADNDALADAVRLARNQAAPRLPLLQTSNILLSSASPDLGDKSLQMTYPRVVIAVETMSNSREEKFRSFSGRVAASATVLASGNLVGEVEYSLHFYVEALGQVLREHMGDLGEGVFYGGQYDVQFQAPKAGGLGFAQAAKMTFEFEISRS